jgi:hypothetical protein
VGPRIALDSLKRKYSCLAGIRTPHLSTCYLATILATISKFPFSPLPSHHTSYNIQTPFLHLEYCILKTGCLERGWRDLTPRLSFDFQTWGKDRNSRAGRSQLEIRQRELNISDECTRVRFFFIYRKESTSLIIILNTGDRNKAPLGMTFESIYSSFKYVFFFLPRFRVSNECDLNIPQLENNMSEVVKTYGRWFLILFWFIFLSFFSQRSRKSYA